MESRGCVQWKNEMHPADKKGERGTNRRRAPVAVRMPGSAPSALPTEPNSSIFSFTVALMASTPGASSLRGSKPLPCLSLPSSTYLRVAAAKASWHSVFTLILETPRLMAF